MRPSRHLGNFGVFSRTEPSKEKRESSVHSHRETDLVMLDLNQMSWFADCINQFVINKSYTVESTCRDQLHGFSSSHVVNEILQRFSAQARKWFLVDIGLQL